MDFIDVQQNVNIRKLKSRVNELKGLIQQLNTRVTELESLDVEAYIDNLIAQNPLFGDVSYDSTTKYFNFPGSISCNDIYYNNDGGEMQSYVTTMGALEVSYGQLSSYVTVRNSKFNQFVATLTELTPTEQKPAKYSIDAIDCTVGGYKLYNSDGSMSIEYSTLSTFFKKWSYDETNKKLVLNSRLSIGAGTVSADSFEFDGIKLNDFFDLDATTNTLTIKGNVAFDSLVYTFMDSNGAPQTLNFVDFMNIVQYVLSHSVETYDEVTETKFRTMQLPAAEISGRYVITEDSQFNTITLVKTVNGVEETYSITFDTLKELIEYTPVIVEGVPPMFEFSSKDIYMKGLYANNIYYWDTTLTTPAYVSVADKLTELKGKYNILETNYNTLSTNYTTLNSNVSAAVSKVNATVTKTVVDESTTTYALTADKVHVDNGIYYKNGATYQSLLEKLNSLNTDIQACITKANNYTPPIAPSDASTTREIFTGMIAIWPFSANDVPSGWLLCNGTQYLRTLYPALSAMIPVGSSWLLEGVPSNKFNTPDLRGMFLRGTGANARWVSAGKVDGNWESYIPTGPDLGKVQQESIRRHSHIITSQTTVEKHAITNMRDYNDPAGNMCSAKHGWTYTSTDDGNYGSGKGALMEPYTSFKDGIAQMPSKYECFEANETRPVNIGVWYIIKT